jgi:hypothetical protein
LNEFRDEKQFKSYEKLKERLTLVLGAAAINSVKNLGSKVEEENLV